MVVLREKSYLLAEMNRGNVLQSSPVQQMSMAAGGPNWWSINGGSRRPPLPTVVPAVVPPQQANFMAPPPPSFFPHHQYFPPPAAPPNNSWLDLVTTHEFLPDSLSQLLMNGILVGDEEEKSALSHMQAAAAKKLENWEQQLLQNHRQIDDDGGSVAADHRYVKQENPASANNYGYAGHDHQFQQGLITQVDANCWSTSVPTPPMIPVSSPSSCVSSLSSTNMLDFSTTKAADVRHPPPPPDRSSECNSTATGGAAKKAKIQHSSTQSPFKVRKEKLGDRITALHQLVSPFGKTDTASVLLEAIGYIRFLQSQIEALSLPYLGNGSGNMRHQHSVQGGEMNCLFPEDPGQLLNDNCMKRKGAPDVQDAREESKKDLRSRGLCLVPVSCTMQVGSDNGADYWAPALNGSFR